MDGWKKTASLITTIIIIIITIIDITITNEDFKCGLSAY